MQKAKLQPNVQAMLQTDYKDLLMIKEAALYRKVMRTAEGTDEEREEQFRLSIQFLKAEKRDDCLILPREATAYSRQLTASRYW